MCGTVWAVQRVTRVNRYWLDFVWGPIGEGTVKPGDSVWMVPMSEERNVARLVDDYLRPYFDRLPTHVHLRLKEKWRYALNAYGDRDLDTPLLSPWQRQLAAPGGAGASASGTERRTSGGASAAPRPRPGRHR